MEWYIKAFIRSSLLWFAGGVILGVAMEIEPAWILYRPAHAHMNVVGFLTMLVFGVGYQLLPRMFGHPLRHPTLAVAHLFLANLGLGGIVLGFFVRPHSSGPGLWLGAVGGILFAAGAVIWVWNLWRTFDAADARARERRQSGPRDLPTMNR